MVSFLQLTSSLDELCFEAEWFLLVGVSISKGIGSKCKGQDIINSCYINFVIKIRHLIDNSVRFPQVFKKQLENKSPSRKTYSIFNKAQYN